MEIPATTAPSLNREKYNVLIEFAYKHLDFQIAELKSVLLLNGIVFGNKDQCEIVPLPSDHECVNTTVDAKNTSRAPKGNYGTARRPFVILSLPMDSKLVPTAMKKEGDDDVTNQPNDIGTILLSRSTLVRSVMELWGVGKSIKSCAQNTKAWTNKKNSIGQSIFRRNSLPSKSWKLTVHTLGAKYTREEQMEMRSPFSFLQFPGTVKMTDPDNEFVLIREIELDAMGSPLYPRHGLGKAIIPENNKRPPIACYFGRALGGARSPKGRGDLEKYSLKRRQYLGPTSMDAELSFIMTNLGQIKKGSIVLDPFVGTGSILLSCALRGAYCVGTDIDIRVLRGRNSDENVLSNFRQFNLPRPELIRSDNAIYHRHFRTDTQRPLYDAIICDPPYGIRAGARRTGSRRENPRPILDEFRETHIAQTKPYIVSDVMADLLNMAAQTLVLGGRLVYIIPSFSDFNKDTDLPRHDCLKLLHACYQPLSIELGRRMICMEKIKEYDVAKKDFYLSTVWKNGPQSAEKCANIRQKIQDAARKKPGYEERHAFKKKKRKILLEARKKTKLKTAKEK